MSDMEMDLELAMQRDTINGLKQTLAKSKSEIARLQCLVDRIRQNFEETRELLMTVRQDRDHWLDNLIALKHDKERLQQQNAEQAREIERLKKQ